MRHIDVITLATTNDNVVSSVGKHMIAGSVFWIRAEDACQDSWMVVIPEPGLPIVSDNHIPTVVRSQSFTGGTINIDVIASKSSNYDITASTRENVIITTVLRLGRFDNFQHTIRIEGR